MPDVPDPTMLLGEWRFTRSIDDRAAGEAMSADGTLTLGVDDGAEPTGAQPTGAAPAAASRIRWSERGTLRIGGRELEVFRTMFVVRRGDGWFVLFEDGRDFHPWTAGEQVEHLCGADLYRGRIELDAPPGNAGRAAPRAWTVRWDVRGPAKDYTMVTRLTR